MGEQAISDRQEGDAAQARSPDHEERLQDFMRRHGGPRPSGNSERRASTYSGFYEYYASDGYVLRFEWIQTGFKTDSTFAEFHASARGKQGPFFDELP